MNNIERLRSVLNFTKPDRLPIVEWASWWSETIKSWRLQGLPDLNSITDISDYFGLDRLKQFWFKPRSLNFPKPAYHGAAIIKSEKDYQQLKAQSLLYPEFSFDKQELQKWAKQAQDGETVIWFSLEGFFWFPRTLFGIENHLYSFFDCPELLHKINSDLVEYSLKQIEMFTDIASPVFMTIAEDMSYNHGPMLSKELFDEFLAPYYRRVVPVIKDLGIKVFVDSDGDVMPLIPWLKEVGVEGLLPLERMAGVDVNRIRSLYPDFLMIGAFDKTVMHKGEAAIRAEFERLLPAIRSGGFIPSVDHQTPPQVSIDDYRLYLKLFAEYANKI